MSKLVTNKTEGEVTPLLLNVMKLNAKIKNGVYKFEEVSCFCGYKKSVIITEKDRYGIFYTLKLCSRCGILYSSPRMTEKSFAEFYEKDYRSIYDLGDPRGEMTQEKDWSIGLESAEYVREFLKEYEIQPKVVFDIGCNLGQFLEVYKDVSAYGVDYDEDNVAYGQNKGFAIFKGGTEKLESLNKKADLVILHHVLEHLSDLRGELNRISKLLNKDSFLYIEVPGLYTWGDDVLFQNAHNWQFNTKTLTYVMNSCGWEALHADAQIKSVWKYTGIINDDMTPVADQAKEIWDYRWGGERILPTFDPTCKFSLKQRRENVRKTLSYKLKDICVINEKESGKEAVIISGGSTIENYTDKIRKMQADGKIVISIERMYQWCQDNNIIPDYVLVMDASDDVIESFDRIHPETTHILATQCNEEIFERLKDENTYIYSSAQTHITFVDSWEDNEYKKVTMLNTGGSVSLGCMSVSMFLGMKKLHIFGFDCHVTKKNYADGITGVGYTPEIFTIDIDGKEYKTTAIYVSFARQFFQMWKLGESIGLIQDVKIYGDSLIKAMSKINIDGDEN